MFILRNQVGDGKALSTDHYRSRIGIPVPVQGSAAEVIIGQKTVGGPLLPEGLVGLENILVS